MKLRFSNLALILGCWSFIFVDRSVCHAEAKRPNVILILADDFGYECVTANGGQSYQTPHLDRLAADGMRFEQCYVQPLCTPTRVQLMTGLSNVRNYIEFGMLDPQATTFAQLVKQSGYVTGIAGKWQLGRDPKLPQHFGFDESFLWQHTRRPPRYANPGLEHNGRELNFTHGEYGPDLVNQFAIDFINRHAERPFFLYYPLMLTHDPFQPTPDSADWDALAQGEQVHRDVKHFAEMTAYMDKLIGRLIQQLDVLKLRENTLILFLGDNGTGRGVTSQFQGKPYPGGKGTGTARGMHVPLIANWPGHVSKGEINRNLISSTDFFPTICAATGADIPQNHLLDGISFLPQLLGQPCQPREILYCWYARDGGPTAQVEFAMTTNLKLYRGGTCFRLRTDPFEASPLTVDRLTENEANTAQLLQAELNRYSTARPDKLAQPRQKQTSRD